MEVLHKFQVCIIESQHVHTTLDLSQAAERVQWAEQHVSYTGSLGSAPGTLGFPTPLSASSSAHTSHTPQQTNLSLSQVFFI